MHIIRHCVFQPLISRHWGNALAVAELVREDGYFFRWHCGALSRRKWHPRIGVQLPSQQLRSPTFGSSENHWLKSAERKEGRGYMSVCQEGIYFRYAGNYPWYFLELSGCNATPPGSLNCSKLLNWIVLAKCMFRLWPNYHVFVCGVGFQVVVVFSPGFFRVFPCFFRGVPGFVRGIPHFFIGGFSQQCFHILSLEFEAYWEMT